MSLLIKFDWTSGNEEDACNDIFLKIKETGILQKLVRIRNEIAELNDTKEPYRETQDGIEISLMKLIRAFVCDGKRNPSIGCWEIVSTTQGNSYQDKGEFRLDYSPTVFIDIKPNKPNKNICPNCGHVNKKEK